MSRPLLLWGFQGTIDYLAELSAGALGMAPHAESASSRNKSWQRWSMS